ncbi:hypothetical protein BABINDRAFT_14577 [Babjeviella inositovora NRRL Y-12698]|uniref:Uncharacterized protein n=1 Tax=Babjeviella inositovora NRRL Y-12698 TaxID=984486 RepID=A0A1E3QL47_9ASCO|nr:uncharacterized protein BABINDRAFT_14577 [Babjeviella inositovora NRRL Y-12698]ODQ78405.1 hypothetical protein BABINDRAFT_14577 [Babjeviella inositovora NRRL Y-12698]
MVNSGSLTSVKSSLYSTTTSISELSSTTTPTSTFLATHDHLPDSRAWRSYLNSPHNFHLLPIETVFREKIRLDTENFWYKQSNTISGTIELAKPVSNMKRATEISSVKVFFEGHISLSDPSWDKMFICEENWLDGVQFPYNLKVGKTLSVPFQFLVPEIISESLPCGEILHQRLPPTSGNTSSCGYLFNNGPLETTHNNILNLQDQNICVTYFIKVLVTGKKDVTVDSSDLLLPSEAAFKAKVNLLNNSLVFRQNDMLAGTVNISKPVSKAGTSEISSVGLSLEGHVTSSNPTHCFDHTFLKVESQLGSGIQFPCRLEALDNLSLSFEFLIPELVDDDETLHQRLPPSCGDTAGCGYVFCVNNPSLNSFLYSRNLQDEASSVTYFLKLVVTGKGSCSDNELLQVTRSQVKVLPSYSAPSPYVPNTLKLDSKVYYGLQEVYPEIGEAATDYAVGWTNRNKLMATNRFAGYDIRAPVPKPLRVNAKGIGTFPIELLLSQNQPGSPSKLASISVKLVQSVHVSLNGLIPTHIPIGPELTEQEHLLFDSRETGAIFTQEPYRCLPPYDKAEPAPPVETQHLLKLSIPARTVAGLRLPPTFHTRLINVTYHLLYRLQFRKESVKGMVNGSALSKFSKFCFHGAKGNLEAIEINVPVVLLSEWKGCPDWAFTDDEIFYGYALTETPPAYLLYDGFGHGY